MTQASDFSSPRTVGSAVDKDAASRDEPLGLTVHTMPTPDESVASAPGTKTGRWKMIGVLLVCAAPVVASYFMYYVVRPEGRRNFGELIDPQRPLPSLVAQDLGGQAVLLPSLKNQWLLISVSGGACDARCEKNLYFQRQLRESLGKEKDRVDRVWLVNDDVPVREALRPAVTAPTSEVLRIAAGPLAEWLTPEPGHRLQDHIYLVDPLGNWMMRWPADMDAEMATKAKRDLDRLLKASAGWDKEGR